MVAKYRNKKIEIHGIKFDSQKEMYRYLELVQFEKEGKIRGLERQKSFELIPRVKLGGKFKPAIRYLCDFSYFDVETDELVVEDVKSAYTAKLAVYRMKKHMMAYLHGIEIKEI
jgi:hypothetical protein